jgi:two-component system, cell cycle sensor histidine kinase and response regulator CckA
MSESGPQWTDEDPPCEVLFTGHPDPIVATDPAGRLLRANPAFERLVGCPVEELRGDSSLRFAHPDDASRVDAGLERAAAGDTDSYDVRGLDAHGSPLLVRLTHVPVGAPGAVTGVFTIARDISERAAAERALADSERRYRGLFEGSGPGIAITDVDGRFIEANPAFLAMIGYAQEELRELDFLGVTHPDDREANRREIAALVDCGRPRVVLEKRYLRKDGDVIWARVSVSLVRDEHGRPLHVAATAEDITTARCAEERLHRSESLRRLAGELALIGGWSLDATDHHQEWSEEIFRVLDHTGDAEPTFEEALRLYPALDRERLEAAIATCLEDGTPFDLELEVVTFAGRRIPVRAIGEADRDTRGRIRGIIGAFQDISDLRRASRAAEEAARRLTTTLESMTDAFFTLDRDWRFTFVNQRAAELLRRDRADLLGRTIWEEFPDAVGGAVEAAFARAMQGEGTQVVEEYDYPPLEACFRVHAYPSDQGLAVYFRDVTSERTSRLALEEREAVLRRQADLLDAAQDAILVRDVSHRITYWNRSAERIYGYPTEEALGADIRELLLEEPVGFDAATAAVFERGHWSGELAQRNRAGEPVTVHGRWTLVRDEAGRPEAVLAINTDVTEQKRVEQQLLRAQRMESLGTLAGGIAHDLNNVLSPVLLATELLQLEERTAEQAALVDTIASSARRGADLVNQVLSFARGAEGERTPIELATLLADIRTIVRDTFPKDIRLTLEVPDQLGMLLGDSTQMQQVLLNLAVNARDAMPDGGELSITASEVTLDDQYVAAMPEAEPGEYFLIEIEDEGTGMPPEVRDRVFEPFFTTKPHGVGTGLGLSTAAAIVRSHGGSLHVYSEVDRGSRFRLYLPVARDEPTARRPSRPAPDLPRGDGETVLVVDDEAAVREMTCQTLRTHGYHTLEAADGAEAVARYAEHRDRIAIVLTDMMMPVMDGPATIRALRNLDPEVRVIGASGLHGNGKVALAARAGVEHFLPKPYSVRGLLDLLADILGADR